MLAIFAVTLVVLAAVLTVALLNNPFHVTWEREEDGTIYHKPHTLVSHDVNPQSTDPGF